MCWLNAMRTTRLPTKTTRTRPNLNVEAMRHAAIGGIDESIASQAHATIKYQEQHHTITGHPGPVHPIRDRLITKEKPRDSHLHRMSAEHNLSAAHMDTHEKQMKQTLDAERARRGVHLAAQTLRVSAANNASTARVAIVIFGVERGFLSPQGWGSIAAASMAEHVVEPMHRAQELVASFMCFERAPFPASQHLHELPPQVRQQLRIVNFLRDDAPDSIVRRKKCFTEVGAFESQHRFNFTHVYFVRTELAWFSDAPLPVTVKDSIVLRARRMRSVAHDVPVTIDHFAHVPSALTCGFETITFQAWEPYPNACQSNCIFLDDQIAAMPRNLAAAFVHPTKGACMQWPVGARSLQFAAPQWGARSSACTKCGFSDFWNEAKLTQPLLDTGCSIELRAFGAMLIHTDDYYSRPGMSFGNMGVLAGDISLVNSFGKSDSADKWTTTTKQEWQWAYRLKANTRIMC